MTLTLGYSGILNGAIPDTATGAWGCRAIVTQDGTVDIVHDRQDFKGDPDVLQALTTRFPLPELVSSLRELLLYRDMSTRRQEAFVLYEDDREQDGCLLTVVADTNGSAGYCYIAAWVVPG
jgi:hypothetical protein